MNAEALPGIGTDAVPNKVDLAAIRVDAISAARLETMRPEELHALERHILDGGIACKASTADTDEQLHRRATHGFLLPEGMDRLYLKDGILHTRLLLGMGITFASCVIVAPDLQVPESVRMEMIGQGARSAVEHPWIVQEATIVSLDVRNAKTRIHLSVPMLPFTSLSSMLA